jgi:hypothetical protein
VCGVPGGLSHPVGAGQGLVAGGCSGARAMEGVELQKSSERRRQAERRRLNLKLGPVLNQPSAPYPRAPGSPASTSCPMSPCRRPGSAAQLPDAPRPVRPDGWGRPGAASGCGPGCPPAASIPASGRMSHRSRCWRGLSEVRVTTMSPRRLRASARWSSPPPAGTSSAQCAPSSACRRVQQVLIPWSPKPR